MTAQTVGQAIAQRDSGPAAMLASYQGDFARVLPEHIRPETFVRLSQGILRRDPDLAAAAAQNPASFLAALLECARLGHEPGTDAYALTHFNNSKTGIPEIVGIEQYQGEIERMYRTGAVRKVTCHVVRENDYYDVESYTGRPDHRPGWYLTDPPGQLRNPRLSSEKKRGPMIGVFAYAEFDGGAISHVVEMGREEVMRHKAVAKSKKFWEGPWEPSMWKKTAIHELEKWVPTSASYRREAARAAAEAAEIYRSVRYPETPPAALPARDPRTGEVIDGEIVPDDGGADRSDAALPWPTE